MLAKTKPGDQVPQSPPANLNLTDPIYRFLSLRPLWWRRILILFDYPVSLSDLFRAQVALLTNLYMVLELYLFASARREKTPEPKHHRGQINGFFTAAEWMFDGI